MKTKIMFAVVLTTFITTTIFAQSTTSFGIRAGVNFQNLNGKDATGDKLDNKLKTGFNAGVNAEIPVGIDFYLQPGLLFSTKGAKLAEPDNKINLSYIELPINFIYKPSLGTGRLIMGFGPYAAFAAGGTYKPDNGEDDDVEFGDQPGEIKRFDAGANLLFGYECSNKLSVQLNAGLGLLNINPKEENTNSDATSKNTGFGLSLGYRF